MDAPRQHHPRLYALLELWILLASRLVPEHRRPAWSEEWLGECWYAYSAVPDATFQRWLRLAFAVSCDALIVRNWQSSYRGGPHRKGDNTVQTLASDIRFGLRTLRKSPVFTAVLVLTLGLGIGATTSIFSVVDALLLHPLPYDDSDRLVILWQKQLSENVEEDWFSVAQFVDIRDQNEVFEDVALTVGGSTVLTGRDVPVGVGYVRATSNYLEMLGAVPLLGRTLGAADDAKNGELVAILTYGLWQRSFGGDANVVGDTLRLGSAEIVIVGVLPRDFALNNKMMPTVGATGHLDLVLSLPLTEERLENRGSENFNIVARTKPGIPLERVRADMDLIAARMVEAHPENYAEDLAITVLPLLDEVVGGVRRPLMLLLGAVGVLLLIACGNAANLLLSRGTARRREMGIRVAVGAGRSRLVRQLLTEGFLLALAGGAVGLVIAMAGVRVLHRMGAEVDLPRLAEIGVDARLLGFAVGVSVVTCLIFGLVPALRASRIDPSEMLHGAGRGTVGGALWARFNLSSSLVITEVALSLVLLIGGGLLARSFVALQRVDPGFSADNILTAKLSLTGERYREAEARRTFYRDLVEEIRTVPGVERAGGVSILPLSSGVAWGSIGIEDYAPAEPDERIVADFRIATSGYFETMRIPLVYGRFFDGRDRGDESAAPVAIVDERFAERIWPGEDPVGKRIEAWDEGWATIVGVAGSVRQYALDKESPRVVVYYSQEQVSFSHLYLTVGSTMEPSALAETLMSKVHGLDPQAAVTDVAPMAERLAQSLAQRRFSMLLLQVFSALALVLAAVGLYGVVAYRVSRGVQDLSIRMALGATPKDILSMVLHHGMVMAAVGVGTGVAAAMGLTKLMQSMLFGVGATDLPTYAVLSAALVGVTLLACWIPAERASRVDPLDGLRE